MKKLFGILFLVALTVQAFASTPTVTITETARTPKYIVYTATFSTLLANTDTMTIYKTGTTPFSIEEIGYEDSLITVEMLTSETTADSTRLTILAQVSSLATPTASQYITAETDATAFTNTSTGLYRFYIRRKAGLARVLRFLVFENDTSKDATQNFTLIINVPRH